MAVRRLTATGELTEAAWQAQIVGLARVYGWAHIYHAPDGGHVPAGAGRRRVAGGQLPEGRGFPDLVLVKGPRLIVAELKSRTGRIGPGQREWLDAFYIAGAEAYIWRPADWDKVQAILGAGEHRRHDLDPLDPERSAPRSP